MNTEICVPTSALQQTGEGGEPMAPGGGDDVEFSGRGRVTREEGGNSYVQLTEINGQPVGGDGGMKPEGDEAAMDREVEQYRGGAGGGMAGLVGLLISAFCILTSFTAQAAPLRMATDRVCSGGAVSNYVATTNLIGQGIYAQVSSVEINNFTGDTLYLLIFDSATNNPANATPHFSAVAIPSGSVGGKDWGASGARFLYGVNVCLSTTPFSLTNASGGGTATIIYTKASE